MSVAAGVQAPVNGLPRAPTEVDEALEYEKILSIYHQVKAGNHPRLRLSGPMNAQPPASLGQHAARVPVTAAAPSVLESAPPAQLPGLQLNDSVQEPPIHAPSLSGSSLSTRPVLPKPQTSELDPIFLTKSDDLVRAEIQLQRQRIERVLREQLEQKRVEARHKPSFAEAKPDFDVVDVLTKAWALVKPVMLDEPRTVNENGSASDSFDENSLYSSKAPDSTPRDADDSLKDSLSKHQVQPVDNDELDADGLVDRRSDEMQQVDLTDSPYKVIPRPAFPTAPNPYSRQNVGRSRVEDAALAPTALDEEADDDEPEYSPPEPTQPAHLRDGRSGMVGEAYVERGRRVNGRHGNQHKNVRSYELPMDADVRITRRPRQDYSQQQRMVGVESERTSPEAATTTLQPRKKRKVQDGRKGARRHAIGSPDPIIKDEPVSPPPFHNVPPLGAAKGRHASRRPIYIDVDAAQDVRYVTEGRHEASARPVVYDGEGHTPHTAPSVRSTAGLNDARRANQDLRRQVSLHQTETREYVDSAYRTPTRLPRASSYVVGESVGRGQEARPFEAAPQTYERPHLVDDRPPPTPAYHDAELGQRYAVQSMGPPPQRRIVVDDYGQRFYETIQPAKASVAPPSGKRLNIDGYNEAVTSRNGAIRAASVLEEPYREARYVQQEMPPPPQMVYRRVTEAPQPATADFRYVTEAARPTPSEVRYIAREPVEAARPPLRSGSVQMYDYSGRQPAYVDDHMAPRESIVRVSSVRPVARTYEEPQERFHRVQSVRPEPRELSVFPEDGPQLRREHVQLEAPRYEVRRTVDGDRYYRIDDGGRMMLDGTVEARPTYAPRY